MWLEEPGESMAHGEAEVKPSRAPRKLALGSEPARGIRGKFH